MKNRIVIIVAACVALLGIGIPLAAAATNGTVQLTNGQSVQVDCGGKNPSINVAKPYASAYVLTCHSTPTTTTTTTQPTTTTTVPPTTTTTVPPTTTTTVPPTTTTTQPSSKNCATGDQANLPSGTSSGAFNDPADINNSNGFNTYVENNVWGDLNINNKITICGTGPSNWNVTTPGIGDAGDQNGAVQAYPNTQQLYTDWDGTADNGTPISQTGAPVVTSTFQTKSPPINQGQWESGYDIWSTQYDSDIMVWENTSTARLQDNGAAVVNPNVVIDGVSYTLLANDDGVTNSAQLAKDQPEMMFVRNTNTESGSVNVDHFVQALQSQGIVPLTNGYDFKASDVPTQLEYGVEVCYTQGSETFNTTGLTFNVS